MKRDLYYLSYGSNTSVRQMLERCPDAIYVGTAELKGWRLLFKGSQSGSYLTIEKKKGRKVPVLVWKVSKRDEKWNSTTWQTVPRSGLSKHSYTSWTRTEEQASQMTGITIPAKRATSGSGSTLRS